MDKETRAAASHEVAEACPYLGLVGDRETHFAFASEENCCHRVVKVAPVALVHQDEFCLNQAHATCPLYQQAAPVLPAALRGAEQPTSRLRVSGLGLALMLAAALVIGVSGYLLVAWSGWLPSFSRPTSQVRSGLPTVTATTTLVILPATPTLPAVLAPPEITVAPTTPTLPLAMASQPVTKSVTAAASLVTATSTPLPTQVFTPTPTPGPAWGTPFGPEQRFLIYQVKPNQSLAYIAGLYQTSETVLRAINPILTPGRSVQPGDLLVIMRGQVESLGKLHFHILFVDKPTLLADLAKLHQATEAELRYYNTLGNGDLVPAGRWLIYPDE
jgi:hypothetical protein